MRNMTQNTCSLFLALFSLVPFSPMKTMAQDSLNLRIEKAIGLEKAAAYYDAVYFYLRSNPGQAKKYASESERFASLENNNAITAYALLNRGTYYSAMGVLDSAIIFLEKAKKLAVEVDHVSLLIKSRSGLGKAYIADGNPEKALANLFEALEKLTEAPDKETEIKVRINIVWAYLELKRHRDCVDFGREGIKLVDQQFEWMLPYFYNNMAISYGAMKAFDSAKYFVEKSVVIAEGTQQYGMLANAHFILGNLFASDTQYDRAAIEYLKAKPYREKTGNIMFIVSDLYTLADLYFKMNNYQKGIDAALEGLAIAEKNNLTLKFEGIYQALARNYEGLGDYKNASKYFGLLAAAKDSVYHNATSKAIVEMQTKYESEKKEHAIKTLEAEARTRQLQIVALLVFSLMVSIAIYLFFSRRTLTLKTQLAEERQQIQKERFRLVIDGEEKEKKRMARELHDGLGQMLSTVRLMVSDIDESNAEPKVVRTLGALDKTIAEVRNLSHSMMPIQLIHSGLAAAVLEMNDAINATGKIAMTLTIPRNLVLDDAVSIAVYRAIQEIVNNSIKYSKASKIKVSLNHQENFLTITITDNGIGFDTAKIAESKGIGWANVYARMEIIGGHVNIYSKPTEGTMVQLDVPIRRVQEISQTA